MELWSNWYFQCDCPRCTDTSESGTFVSALKCCECHEGLILPETTHLHSTWRCRSILIVTIQLQCPKSKVQFQRTWSDSILLRYPPNKIRFKIDLILSQTLCFKLKIQKSVSKIQEQIIFRFCNAPFGGDMIQDIIDTAESQLREISSNPSVKQYESFIRRNTRTFHMKHYLILLGW